MRTEERYLITALNEKAVNTVVEIMMDLCGDFLEGEDDIAGDIFNKYFPKLHPKMQKKFIHLCPWEKLANRLAEKYHITKPWKVTDPEKPWKWQYVGLERNPHFGWETPKLQVEEWQYVDFHL